MTRKITFNGKTQSIKEWADELSIPYKTLYARLQNNWEVEKAMSSTNRGAKRQDNDFYPTPQWLINAVLNDSAVTQVKPNLILEPACGDGILVKSLEKYFSKAKVEHMDISPHPDFPTTQMDFLNFKTDKKYDLIITNPPFKLAEKFIKKSEGLLTTNGRLVLLLRINFFGGQERSLWLKENMPRNCLVTPRRPSFVGVGSDSTEYAWFVWDKNCFGKNYWTTLTLLNTQKQRYVDKYLKSLV